MILQQPQTVGTGKVKKRRMGYCKAMERRKYFRTSGEREWIQREKVCVIALGSSA